MNESQVPMSSRIVLDEILHDFPVAKEESVAVRLKEETESEQLRVSSLLKRDNPFTENARALQIAENEIKSAKSVCVDQLEQDLHHFESLEKQTHARIVRAYWLSEEISKLREDQENLSKIETFTDEDRTGINITDGGKLDRSDERAIICRRLILQRWRRLLDEQTARWELEKYGSSDVSYSPVYENGWKNSSYLLTH